MVIRAHLWAQLSTYSNTWRDYTVQWLKTTCSFFQRLKETSLQTTGKSTRTRVCNKTYGTGSLWAVSFFFFEYVKCTITAKHTFHKACRKNGMQHRLFALPLSTEWTVGDFASGRKWSKTGLLKLAKHTKIWFPSCNCTKGKYYSYENFAKFKLS